MANLKEVRERIRSVQNTQQITSAMKMVSAAKLRRAQMAITDMRPYANKLNDMLRNILANLDGDASTSFNQERPLQRAALVVVTSNRGLAGAFNTNVIKSAVKTLKEDLSGATQIDVYAIGKKGNDYFRRNFAKDERVNLISDYVGLFEDLAFDNTQQVPLRIMNAFEAGDYDRAYVSYARFRNAAVQFAETEQFLPVLPPEVEEGAETGKFKADYIFEPSQEELLNYLVPSILQTSFHKYLLDTHASEHGARMTAMDKATENAQELLRDLKISYNKARQEAITNEILEIVGGAAALEDG
ncbi:ATP synthase F1 subunit gamma [Lewinellaceae bacterium SD302]|nr:ATP synthase F1 subunit gamma [Lewinellaceae bacterium SD302]